LKLCSHFIGLQVEEAWGPDVHLVIAGLTNTYSSYVTTFEEYQVQRYEGGFTLFGPHTLDAYIQEFRKLAAAMVAGEETPLGPQPPNLLPKQWSLVPGVVADGVPWGADFGKVSQDVQGDLFYPGDVVTAEFHSGCPRNNIHAEGTYLTVERLTCGGTRNASCWGLTCAWAALKRFLGLSPAHWCGGTAEWKVVHTDADWETKFAWKRHASLSTYSFATITWEIPEDVEPGTYRLRHFGDYKHFLGHVRSFEGASREFEVRGREEQVAELTWRQALLAAFGRRGIFD